MNSSITESSSTSPEANFSSRISICFANSSEGVPLSNLSPASPPLGRSATTSWDQGSANKLCTCRCHLLKHRHLVSTGYIYIWKAAYLTPLDPLNDWNMKMSTSACPNLVPMLKINTTSSFYDYSSSPICLTKRQCIPRK